MVEDRIFILISVLWYGFKTRANDQSFDSRCDQLIRETEEQLLQRPLNYVFVRKTPYLTIAVENVGKEGYSVE